VCDPNQAYTFGLFRDAGMPAMFNKNKADYEDILNGTAATGEVPITRIEQERYGLTHAQVGAYLGTTWHLDESVWKAILLHHDYDKWLPRGRELAARTAALGLLAEEIYARHERNVSCPEWALGGHNALVVLGIDLQQVEELRAEVSRALDG
jgi:HD-like signal output (HDOD) protein